jgi:hypothetical protein
MGEQLPMETLSNFVKSALPKMVNSESGASYRKYYSRDARVADSFEARRAVAPKPEPPDPPAYGQTEFFEYHWS